MKTILQPTLRSLFTVTVALTVMATVTVFLSSCSAGLVRPDLYPNDKLKMTDKTTVDQDVQECNDLAKTYVNDSTKYDQIARESGTGAVIGSASGALAGVIVGSNVGRSLGAGAAVGAIVPLLQRAFTSDKASPNHTHFVELCLSERGYQVL